MSSAGVAADDPSVADYRATSPSFRAGRNMSHRYPAAWSSNSSA